MGFQHEKSKETFLNKMGVDNPMKDKSIRDIKKETCLRKYGAENISQLKYIKEKKRKTLLKNHPDGLRDEKITEKKRNTYKERTGYDHPMKNPEVLKKRKENRENKINDGDFDSGLKFH